MADFTFTLATEVLDFLNECLGELGVQSVTGSQLDATSGQSEEEIKISRDFHKIMKSALSRHAFRSITKTVNLVPTSSGSAIWTYQTTVPSDFLRLNELHPASWFWSPSRPIHIDYEVANGVLYTHSNNVDLIYNYYPVTTGYDDNPAVTTAWNAYMQVLHPKLRDAVKIWFVHELVMPLRRDRQWKFEAYQQFLAVMNEAKSEDKAQGSVKYVPDGPLVEVRMG